MSSTPPDPDVVPVGFAATDAPGALLRRRRPWRTWASVAAMVVGAVLTAVSVWAMFRGTGDVDGRAVASGTVAALDGPSAEPARFTAPRSGRYTVWLRTDGITLVGNREAVVAATVCDVRRADGTVSTFRGSRQGESVTIGDRSTVGTFTAGEGQVEVSCRQEPFGRRRGYDRLRSERSFLVAPGPPGSGIWPMLAVTAGMLLVIFGAIARSRAQGGGVRRRVPSG